MSVYEDQYVIINIWTNSKNNIVSEDDEVNRISITTPNTHFSLWPQRNHPRRNGFFKDKRDLFSLMSLSAPYKPDYEQDCILEGAAYNMQRIGDKPHFKKGERSYRYNSENGFYEQIDSAALSSNNEYYKIKPREANHRVVLYSLDAQKIVNKFNHLKHDTEGWTLIAPNARSVIETKDKFDNIRYNPGWVLIDTDNNSSPIGEERNESCSSLIYHCLKAGGLHHITLSQRSQSAQPENWLHDIIVAEKKRELRDYPETIDWVTEGIKATSLDTANEVSKESKARETLLKACEGYIQHNQNELDALSVKSLERAFAGFFREALGKEAPQSGFNDWFNCQYYTILKTLIHHGDKDLAHYLSMQSASPYHFEPINPSSLGLNQFSQLEPELVLHHLTTLGNVLNYEMGKRFPDLEQLKSAAGYKENNLVAFNDAPLSVQMYKTLENLKLRAHFGVTLKTNQSTHLIDLSKTVEEAYPVLEGYLKGIAVNELHDTLEYSGLNDREAIKEVREQLENGVTVALLSKNRQSQTEQDLKLLSVIAIFIGIGIFTTLGLVCKRLYDSGGTSINFFKPLSQNLYETFEEITAELDEDSIENNQPLSL